jgi:phosphoglycolate phosphatase
VIGGAPFHTVRMHNLRIRLAVIDAGGTTIRDEDVVITAFVEALAAFGAGPDVPGFDDRMRYVKYSMGRTRLDVFRYLLRDNGKARLANRVFEAAVEAAVVQGDITPFPGAREAIDELRSAGIAVCLTTSMSQRTLDRIVATLGWSDVVDLTLAPGFGVRSRPHPDLVLMATMRLGIDSVREVAVVGDTVADLVAGSRAGASVVIGVSSGAHDLEMLQAVPHTHLLGGIDELPGVLIGQRVPMTAA